MKKRLIFTLIELLIVISIIAILASILLPALGRARDRAKSMICLNQQKQLKQSISFYENDYNAIYFLMYNAGWLKALWAHDYMRKLEIFYCPLQPLTKAFTPFNVTYFKTTYGMMDVTSYGKAWFHLGTKGAFLDFKKIKQPSTTLLGGDSYTLQGAYAGNQYYTINPTVTTSGLPHARHMGNFNFMFADGHVQLLNPRKYKENYIQYSGISSGVNIYYYKKNYTLGNIP
jgi:prepilin-type N-terminal cleavage/methylation domain-containing protein/prepilin-type processing-associated H-X9-DG protein